jgi:SPP1 gp7 family putative phage head morphogenesis protein
MVRNNLRLPKTRFRDATRTTMLQNTYYKKLIGLFDKFQEKLQPHMTTILDNSEGLGFVQSFNGKITTVANSTIMIGSPEIVYDNIRQAYIKGKKAAAENPRIRMNSIIIPYQFNRLDQRVVEDLKTRNLGMVTKLTEDMRSDLLRTLTDGVKLQQSTEDIVRAINQQIPDITRPRAKMIARTEISYAYNSSVSRSYQSIGIDKWQWLSAMGSTVCPECASLHGQVFDFSDPEPPLHPNCFCTIYPVVDKEFKR